jgi:hypothetical protein
LEIVVTYLLNGRKRGVGEKPTAISEAMRGWDRGFRSWCERLLKTNAKPMEITFPAAFFTVYEMKSGQAGAEPLTA